MTTLHESGPEKPADSKSAGESALSGQHQHQHQHRSSSADEHHLIRFSRDFSEATSAGTSSNGSGPSSLVPESLSSASSFQSLASTLSSKSSSGICVDSAPGSPDKTVTGSGCFDSSYVNVDIPDLDDLISACANINLNRPSVGLGEILAGGEEERGADSPDSSGADLSQDQTFASAADDTIADSTQILVEETIQTFQTCPTLEATQVSTVVSSTSYVFKTPLPVDEPSSSSVIPYLTFEESVLSKHQASPGAAADEEGAEFKSALTSFQVSISSQYQPDEARRHSYSPTPCEEIDVAQVAVKCKSPQKLGIVEEYFICAEEKTEERVENVQDVQQDIYALDSPDASFEEVQTFNSTVVLPSHPVVEESNVSPSKASDDLYLSVSKATDVKTPSKSEAVVQPENKVPAPDNVETIVQKEVETPKENEVIVQETKTPSSSENIVQETNTLNQTAVVEQEINILIKTQDIVSEQNTLNKTQDIVQEEGILNKTQDIVQEEGILNKTQDIVQEEGILNKTQDIVQEEGILNKTQDILQEQDILNKTQDIVQEQGILNKTQDILQEQDILNKIQDIVLEQGILNKTPDILQEQIILNKTQDIVQEQNILNKTQDKIDKENNLNKTEVIVQEIKTSSTSEIIVQKANNTPNKSQVTDQEVNNLNNTEVVQNETQTLSKVDILVEKEELLKSNSEFKAVEEQFKVPIQEVKTPNANETSAQNTIKTPNKTETFPQKQALTPTNCESFVTEESQHSNLLSTEVVASTPLPAKTFNKEDTPRTLKVKSALFTNEPKSPKSQSPQVLLIQGNNTPVKSEETKEEKNKLNFDQTLAVNKSLSFVDASDFITKENLEATANVLHEDSFVLPPQEPDYEAFKPQQQSTTLPFPDFRKLQEAALSVAKDIDASLEKIEESEQFVSASTELFGDPSALDFFNQVGSQQTSRRGERYDSLYMKFDPLAQRLSMLPQKNLPTAPSVDEEEETKADTPISNMGTPKKNPALAAIDRLLFYSPCPPASTDSAVAEAKQKKEEAEKQEPQLVPIVDEKMAKELELVRSTVLHLEAELEKQKQEHKEQLEKQKAAFEDKVSLMQAKFGQMQSQLAHEVKDKNQMTVVVDEYEKSISRLIAEREKDRTTFEMEKAKIQEELQVANQHLSNTEAAFSDVHSKYERLKNVVSAYKSNETVLKESIAENQDTIKTLESRYEQLKSHAMAQLEKANLELSAIRKQNEAETVKLKALVRKAELKSKSLAETVEQKVKENKELTQIIDEMIARVD